MLYGCYKQLDGLYVYLDLDLNEIFELNIRLVMGWGGGAVNREFEPH